MDLDRALEDPDDVRRDGWRRSRPGQDEAAALAPRWTGPGRRGRGPA
ncbi:MAG: hypothetical protein MZV64_18145 [Ignavibacteriales bacterium]|nr:hypothetical protein [Ignavibacteriales bacterium]